MYPIRFKPIYQTYVWGGDRIKDRFGRKTDLPRIAESWEISDRDDAMSVVENGPWKGKTLHQLVVELGEDLLGVGQKFSRFPILTKIIDAKENLSVQVHPDETVAPKLNGEAKDEIWVMLEEGSVLAGFQEGVQEEDLKKAIQKKRADQLLEKLDLKKGEAVNIPGGRIHAICGGSLLYEVQQNSNTTYRIFDWGRERELHIKEGLASIRWDDKSPSKVALRHLSSDLHHQIVTFVVGPFFIAERIDVFDLFHLGRVPKSFQILFCLSGKGEITVEGETEPFEAGMTYLIPAAAKGIDIKGRCQAVRVRLP